jgi:hypothetical protein
MVAEAMPAVAWTDLGAPGAPTIADAAVDGAEVPPEFFAVTVTS